MVSPVERSFCRGGLAGYAEKSGVRALARKKTPPFRPAGSWGIPMTKVLRIPLREISVHRPTRPLSEAAIPGLMESIREIGLQNPVHVRKTRQGYELISGFNRFEACRQLGHENIPAIVME